VFYEFQTQVRKAAELDPWMKEHPPEINKIATVFAADIDANHPIVQSLKRSYKAVTGGEPIVTGKTAGTEQRLLVHRAKTPAVNFGVCGGGAHSPNEYLGPVESLFTVTKSIALTLLDWCGFQD
jgi:acetylornithine deacetylase